MHILGQKYRIITKNNHIYLYVLLLFVSLPSLSNNKVLNITDSIDRYNPIHFLQYVEDKNQTFGVHNLLQLDFNDISTKRAIWGDKNTPFWFITIVA
jgi:hypothetical protein